MNYKTTLLILSSLLLLNGCGDSDKNAAQVKEPLKIIEFTPIKAPQKAVAKSAKYTIDEIYNAMCVQCHSSDGSGNTEKLTPSMAHLSEKEMITELKEVEADQGHVIMEHNRGEILKMGMEYRAKDMAEYMFKRFNK